MDSTLEVDAISTPGRGKKVRQTDLGSRIHLTNRQRRHSGGSKDGQYIIVMHHEFLALCFMPTAEFISTVRDNYNLKSHKYVCITTYQPDTKSNPNRNPTTKQHAIVNIQLHNYSHMSYISR